MTNYSELKSIPVLMDEYRNAVKDVLPVVGTKRNVNSTPNTGFIVKGVKVDVNHLAGYVAAARLPLNNELPSTYPYVLSFPLMMKLFTQPDFPVKAVGLVHLTNVIEQTRPLTVSDSLDFQVHTASVRPHYKGLLVDMETTVTVDGEQVWKQTSTMLALGQKLKDSKQEPTNGYLLEQPGELEDPTARATFRVTAPAILEYAEASGDKNPIHTSKLGAKAFGFPTTIAHGMWTAAAVLRALGGDVPGAQRFTIQFAKPVLLPSSVSVFVENRTETAVKGDKSFDISVRKASKLNTIHAVAKVEAL